MAGEFPIILWHPHTLPPTPNSFFCYHSASDSSLSEIHKAWSFLSFLMYRNKSYCNNRNISVGTNFASYIRIKIILSCLFFFPIFRDVKQKMEDQRREEEQARGAVKKKRKFKNPFKRRPKTREEKIEAWLEN